MTPDAIEDPLATLDSDRLRRAFALGSARGELEAVAAGAHPLTLLALFGQQLRFGARRAPRLALTGRRLPSSATPIAPREVRVALIRLFESTTRAESQNLVAAALEAVATAGFRLHPFDLTRLGSRLAGKQEWLGPVERAYLAFQRTVAGDDEEEAEGEITRDNWTAAAKPRRLEFIRGLRLSDPDEARSLIERSFAGLRAPVRTELVGVLELGLGPVDRSFLESLAGDRAPSVREAAASLLSRLPGTEAYDTRVREALEMVSLTRAGMLKLRRVIKVEPPKLPDEQIDTALWDRFRGVPLRAILAALEVPPVELEAAVQGADRRTAMCLLWAAFADGNLDRAGAIARVADISSVDALEVIEPDLASAPTATRRSVVAMFLDLRELASAAEPPAFARLRGLLAGPLSEPQARQLLDPDTWKLLVDRLEPLSEYGPGPAAALVAAAATLVPTSLSSVLLERLEPLSSETAAGARRFAELSNAITRASAALPDPSTSARE